jgi:hypothetical protein
MHEGDVEGVVVGDEGAAAAPAGPASWGSTGLCQKRANLVHDLHAEFQRAHDVGVGPGPSNAGGSGARRR